MRVGDLPRVIDRLPTAALIGRAVILDRVLDGERAGAGVVPVLPQLLGKPPVPRRLLGLPIVEDCRPSPS